MSEVQNNEEFITILNNESFLRLVDHSQMGITLIRRGFLLYFNKKFEEIFGYTEKDIRSWEKFEYFKIIHADDIPNLLKMMKIEDAQNVAVQFRGVKKDGSCIPIENYIYRIKHNNKYAYFSTYIQIRNFSDETAPHLMKEKKIIVDYNPRVIKLLEDNNIEYKTIKQSIYREK